MNRYRKIIISRLLFVSFLITGTVFGQSGVQDDVSEFDIPAQPLTSALLQLSDKLDLSIGFPDKLTAGIHSPGAKGEMTTSQALEKLLEGTGLTFIYVDEETLTILTIDNGDSGDLAEQSSVSKESSVAESNEPLNQEPGNSSQANSEPPVVLRSTVGSQHRKPNSIEEVVVVGSQIVGAQVTNFLPVTVLNDVMIASIAATSGDELFRALPSAGAVLFNGVDTYRSGVNDARGDVASINLRSIGTGNTLVLLNGRRLVNHPGTQAEGLVPTTTINMNTIPVIGLKRIEVFRDGASALYGSDAVAGVINLVLDNDFEGLEAVVKLGSSEDTDLNEITLNLHGGVSFNAGQGKFSFYANHFKREGILSDERLYSRSSELRPLVEGTDFEGDTDFRNSGRTNPWGQFQLAQPVRQNGQLITSSTGRYHIQPDTFNGCLTNLSNNLCIDDGNSDETLRYDKNADRSLVPEVDRSIIFAQASNKFNHAVEGYAELSYYYARSKQFIEPATAIPSHPITLPANNYWNPFGPVNFSDGRVNPNRLPGIDAPVDGLGMVIQTNLGTRYRIVDNRVRTSNVDNDRYRILAGLRGQHADWGWDTAILYAQASTLDLTENRVSNTLFQQALANETEDAYNPFNGADPLNPTFGDASPNPDSVLNNIFVDVKRKNTSTLGLIDFKLSNPFLFQVPAGNIGMALGIEARYEAFEEDRDDRLDGSITYTDLVTGIAYGSDVLGTSPTTDAKGSRNVFSAFSEIAIPVINPDMNIPLLYSLDMQVAARYENFSDVGSVIKPRLAYSWHPMSWLQVRGSYSQGFRAPNLAQVSNGTEQRVRGATDWIRCQALVNKGVIADLGACSPVDVPFVLVERITTGSEDLKPEDNTSFSTGFVFTPEAIDNLVFTFDYWKIKQKDIVAQFGVPNHMALDWALRLNGSSNDVLIREQPTQADIDFFAGSGIAPVGTAVTALDSYLNLDSRVTEGFDLALLYQLNNTALGDFTFDFTASKLHKAEQSLSSLGTFVTSQGEPAVVVSGDGDLIEQDGRPKWKLNGNVNWFYNNWQAGVFINYISGIDDTSATQNQTQDSWRVKSWFTINSHIDYSFDRGKLEGSGIRLGVRNIFDEDPPLADEHLGYNAALHNNQGRYWYVSMRYAF